MTLLFGEKAPGLGANVQPQQQMVAMNPASSNLQDILQDTTTLSTAVAGPELFGDERDGVISLLNKLLASMGVGSGYYRPGGQPYNFTPNNFFYRFRGVGYNRLSKHKNSEGLVSLVLAISPNDLNDLRNKQKVIDTVNSMLNPKPTTNVSFGQQQTQQSVQTIRMEIQSIVPLDDSNVELMITARGPRGHLASTELFGELMQQDRANQLKQSINCQKIVPHVEVDKSELERYLRKPPNGFEELWMQAIKNNPDPINLVPYPIQGFSELNQRKKVQNSTVRSHLNHLKEITEKLMKYDGEILDAHNHYVGCVQRQKLLSYRILRILLAQIMAQRFGASIDENEEQIKSASERMDSQLNAPDKIKDQISSLINQINMLRMLTQKHGLNVSIKSINLDELKRCLGTRQSLLEELSISINKSTELLKSLENNL